MTDCERTALYFDGELAASDEAGALAHLAGCAACQAELGDWMGIELALSRRRARLRRYAPWLAGAVVAAAAAAVAVVWLRSPAPSDAPAIALAEARPIEARLTAPAFAGHRPYRVPRSGAGRELIPLETMAGLERRGDHAALAAAQLLGRDLARAAAALDAEPASAARDSDRAAVALVGGDPATALQRSDAALAADPALSPAHWNRALALQALDLPLAAAAELALVAARGEPGWATEAAARAEALRAPLADRARDLAAYQAAAGAMVAGTGPAIPSELARRHLGLARRDLLDALAATGSADEVRGLSALAGELDRDARDDHATRALTAVLGRDFAVRRRFQASYRALVAGTLDDAAAQALVDQLARAGAAASDILAGAILSAPRNARNLARLAADDGWLAISRARYDGQIRATAGDLFGAEHALLEVAAACRAPAWALVCGGVALDLGQLYERMRRLDEADVQLRAARAAFATAGATAHEDYTLVFRVSLERLRDRDRLAAAYLDEIGLRAPERCDNTRFVDESQAVIAFDAGDLATARRRMPAPERCGLPPDAAQVILATDLARIGDASDRPRAIALIAAARSAGGSSAVAAAIADGRLGIATDPAAGTTAIRAGLAQLTGLASEPGTAGELRAWAYATLIGDAGQRGDWAGALARFGEELGGVPAGCVAAVSRDNERATAVVRGPDGQLAGAHQAAPTIPAMDARPVVPPALAAALAGCPEVSVIARAPLHGRDDLLPPALPWSLVGRPTRSAARALPPRRVVVTDARPPAALGLPPLAAVGDPRATLLTGEAATPTRVAAELRDATYVELHAHGIVDADTSDATFIALSPDGDGQFALTAAQVRQLPLTGAPIVVLAACHGAKTASRDRTQRWSLPDAFLAAGARAVIAASTAIPDDQGGALFAELRARLDRGESPAHAVAAVRAARVAAGQAWAAGLLVFE